MSTRTIGLGNSLFHFWTHGDIAALQAEIAGTLQTTNTDVQNCTALPAASKTAWTTFYTTALAQAQASAAWFDTGDQADTLQEIQRGIRSWQQMISGKGCTLSAPLYDGGLNPDPPKPPEVTQWLKYGAIIATAWGVSYVVSQVVEFIPKPVK